MDVSNSLSRIAVSLLYLRAAEDSMVPAASGKLIASLAAAKITEFPAPHFLLQVLPNETATAVREFMEAESKH